MVVFVLLLVALLLLLAHGHWQVLTPSGTVGIEERSIMLTAIIVMLIVVVPVFFLLFFFAWHYRAGNEKAKYTPDWEHSAMDELVWWAIPCEIILVLGALAWNSAHALDPYRALAASPGGPSPITIEVVSLDWKWLFIYPAEGIATVNYLAIPVGTPITFDLTSDAPMNAFWIPDLGGQEMTMPGMETKLNLVANAPGQYRGVSSNLSGDGFAGMSFPVYAMSENNFTAWAAQTASSTNALTWQTYEALAAPSENNPPAFYTLADPNLYTQIIMSYMVPSTTPAPSAPSTMNMGDMTM